jgi:hypothetical protein
MSLACQCGSLYWLPERPADAFWGGVPKLRQIQGPGGEVRMLKEESIMNEQIRKAIRHRASKARTKTQLVKAVFDSFRSSQIDPGGVSLEDMKTAIVVAAIAAREAGQKNPEGMPA